MPGKNKLHKKRKIILNCGLYKFSLMVYTIMPAVFFTFIFSIIFKRKPSTVLTLKNIFFTNFFIGKPVADVADNLSYPFVEIRLFFFKLKLNLLFATMLVSFCEVSLQ